MDGLITFRSANYSLRAVKPGDLFLNDIYDKLNKLDITTAMKDDRKDKVWTRYGFYSRDSYPDDNQNVFFLSTGVLTSLHNN